MPGRNPLNFELRVFLQGLRQKQHRWGAAWGIQKRFSQKILHRDRVDTEELSGLLFGRCGYPFPKEK